ncbi:MAG: tetratricopeptide repeat protein [candidate division Zixibacteria bacterium]|nr:tetratricopeptide repeat protein [candidate division Zixibacteria bacterium]
MKRLKNIIFLLVILLLTSGCVYYNTFYYARKTFDDAQAKRKAGGRDVSGKTYSTQYGRALEKSQKIIDKYPNSGWYDDALYVNGVSGYYMEDYTKAEKRFRELIANYPKSEYLQEAQLYLAKSKLKLGEEADAMTLFEKLQTESRDKSAREEATLTLGEYYFQNKDYPKAEYYFSVIVDSLGNDEDKRMAQMYIADGYYARFNYKNALKNYLKILNLNPALHEQYKATFMAGECSLFLHEIDDGIGFLNRLEQNKLFYDSLSAVRLMIAFGYELDGDIALAENTYKQVALEGQRQAAAIANYNLGLIYQFDYENYNEAKEYYDKAKNAGATDIYQDALQRSSDIGKLEEYSRKKALDTGLNQDKVDDAAETQYFLAELYLTQLGKPDSALREFEHVVEHFRGAFLTPKALIAMALIKRNYYDDTLAFDTTLQMVLREYPRSDFVPEALELLGLRGTAADTGYAESYYRRGEHFTVDTTNIDSARYYYRYVADSFPRSTLNNQAKFALIWLSENYQSPGDSSLYYAYAHFADSFANTEFGKVAGKKLTVRPKMTTYIDTRRLLYSALKVICIFKLD